MNWVYFFWWVIWFKSFDLNMLLLSSEIHYNNSLQMFDSENSFLKPMYFISQWKKYIVARSRLYFNNFHSIFRNLQNRGYNIWDIYYVVCAFWLYVFSHGTMAMILKATKSLGPVSWELLNYIIRTEEGYWNVNNS